MEQFWNIFLAHFGEIAATIIMGFLVKFGFAVERYLKANFNITLEQKDKDAIHSALQSGVRAALQEGLTQSAAVTFALRHAQKSVPQALERMQPTVAVLENIALSKIRG